MEWSGWLWARSAEGQLLLATLTNDPGLTPSTLVNYVSRLRQQHPPSGVRAVLELALARRAAQAKLPHAERLFFTREAVEQATPWPVAAYRATRFADCQRVADLACSVGGDALPLAAHTHVLAVDNDSLRLAMLSANAEALGLSARITPVEADITSLELAECDAIFFDPARRQNGRRIWDVEQYLPPLSTIERWPAIPLRAAKVAPGIPDEQVPPACAIEFISLDGDLREATLWWGADPPGTRRATLLHSAGPPLHLLADPSTPPAPLRSPGAFLYEPDPAVIRAHAVADLAQLLEAGQLDPTIAYLTADTLVSTPFARAWRIEASMPFNLKQLRRVLQSRDVGRVTVKKRGSPISPDQLQKQLRLHGSREQVVVLTHVAGTPSVLLCQPLNQSAER